MLRPILAPCAQLLFYSLHSRHARVFKRVQSMQDSLLRLSHVLTIPFVSQDWMTSTSQGLGCCSSGISNAKVSQSSTALISVLKSFSLTASNCGVNLATPCTQEPSIDVLVYIPNLAYGWYLSNSFTADQSLLQEINYAFGYNLGQVVKYNYGSDQSGLTLDLGFKPFGSQQADIAIGNIQTLRSKNYTLSTTSAFLPTVAKIDPSKPISFTVKAINYPTSSGAAAGPQTYSLVSFLLINIAVKSWH
ncbi:hypothetical protein GUITHDRAFT_144361 [Guillardia theta CCMP2712]|uniref:Uncharacterized protein n=1 Tax=Guillardia theta (strain CCMP2712) TaxID=905079 RepID=L1IQ91_GUITC|nr:hypothetical protein GUITHDRAFT_144361 [Guillardia theta CCMP2712]EKX38247.1 hypothetical protein GUITHDRAFT_144361 [Guillardia theta CCMP2712]|eukprot:XP_005825227.1 hypothetical protein GUITHDRAFT_144361 [Guillardia theta CCMP2712]